MAKRIVLVTAKRTFVQKVTVEIEVDDSDLINKDLQDYLTECDEVDIKVKQAFKSANLVEKVTKYRYDDSLHNEGGHL